MMPADPGSREWCRLVAKRLDCLAQNLAAAGGLCHSFELGLEKSDDPPPWSFGHYCGDLGWYPGCGMRAP